MFPMRDCRLTHTIGRSRIPRPDPPRTARNNNTIISERRFFLADGRDEIHSSQMGALVTWITDEDGPDGTKTKNVDAKADDRTAGKTRDVGGGFLLGQYGASGAVGRRAGSDVETVQSQPQLTMRLAASDGEPLQLRRQGGGDRPAGTGQQLQSRQEQDKLDDPLQGAREPARTTRPAMACSSARATEIRRTPRWQPTR